jgi:hypothetical protein
MDAGVFIWIDIIPNIGHHAKLEEKITLSSVHQKTGGIVQGHIWTRNGRDKP